MLKKTSIAATVALSVMLTAGGVSDFQRVAASDQQQIQFSDTQGHWAEDAIKNAVAGGIVDGYPDGSFKPDADISRAEFIKLVVTATGTKTTAVDGANWYQSYVDVLKQRHVLRDDDFSDYNTPMNRLEMAKVALREARDDVRDSNAIMSDASYIYSAVKSGLIDGMTDSDLGVNGKTTRAQSLTVIDRVKKMKNGETLKPTKNALNLADLYLNGTNMRTVLGLEAISFPFDASWSDDIKFTVNRLIIIDGDDENDPNRHLLDEVVPFDDKPYDGRYVFVYDATLEVLQVGENVTQRVTNNFGMNAWVPAYSANYNKNLRFFNTSKDKIKKGYVYFLFDKKRIDTAIANKRVGLYLNISGKPSIVLNKN